jgi:ABC-type nitrate/sulfonate/bicarbonate transport system permease component
VTWRRVVLIKVACLGNLFSVWEIFAILKHNPQLFPTVGSIITISLPSLGIFSQSGAVGLRNAITALAYHSGLTVMRIAAGLLVGAPSGVAFGLLMHWLRGSGRTSALALLVVRSIPLLALIPLFSFWFGASTIGIVSYIGFGVFVVVASDAYEAAANLSPSLLQLASLLGARRSFLLRSTYLPGIAGHMAGSVRNVLGLTWALSLGAEYVSATSGLGYLAYQSYLYSDMGKLAVLAFTYMGLGYATYELTRKLVMAFTLWQAEGKGGQP